MVAEIFGLAKILCIGSALIKKKLSDVYEHLFKYMFVYETTIASNL